jgi:hypothetical protein
MPKNKFLLVLILIVLLGSFLRFHKLGNNSFVADEFLDINTSYGYAKTGNWKSWDFNLEKPAERENDPSDQRAWIYRWQVAQILKKFPPTEAAARSVSAAWGIISILAIYWVSFRFTGNKYIGLISAFLFAVSASGIVFDRRLRMYAMFLPIFLLFSWFVFQFLESRYKGKNKYLGKVNERLGINILYLLPAVLLGYASHLTHELTVNIIPVFIAYCAVLFLFYFLRDKRVLGKFRAPEVQNRQFPAWGKYAGILALAGLAAAALYYFYPAVFSQFGGKIKIFNNNYSYFSKVFSDYSHPLLAVVFLSWGIFYLCQRARKLKEAAWIAVSFIFTVLMAVFIWRRNAGGQYIFFILPFGIILISAGIYAAAEFFKENLAKYKNKALAVSLAVSLLLLPNYGYFFEENNAYRQTSKSDNPNYRRIFGYFKKHRLESDVLITRNYRNYYFGGEKVKVFSFGGELAEKKLDLDDLEKILESHPSGWIIYSDNDERYISGDARNFIGKNMEKINAIEARGKVSVYRWK